MSLGALCSYPHTSGQSEFIGHSDKTVIMSDLGQPAATGSANHKVCILVLGMHRSGTSALTRVLSLAGAKLPRAILGAGGGNDAGHWEPENLVNYNDKLLAEFGSRWDDWRRLNLSTTTQERVEQIKAEIGHLINSEYDGHPLIVVKDPRLCRFSSFFAQSLTEAGFETRNILIFRNPIEVARSLERRNALAHGQSILLWLRHVLDSEADTRGSKRTILSYDDLLTDWASALSGIGQQLDISWPNTTGNITEEIQEFLTPEHRHHRIADEESMPHLTLNSWLTDTLTALSQLREAPHSAEALKALDRVRMEFDSACDTFEQLRRIEASQDQHALDISLRDHEKCVISLRTKMSNDSDAAARKELELADRDATIAHLSSLMAQAELKIEALGGALAASTGAETRLRADIAERNARIADLIGSLAVRDNEMQRLEASKMELDAQFQELTNSKLVRLMALFSTQPRKGHPRSCAN
jgi:hypothetical protein